MNGARATLAALTQQRLRALSEAWQRREPSALLAERKQRAPDVFVEPSGPVSSLRDALRLAPSGALIRLAEGVYRERLRFERPVSIEGVGAVRLELEPGSKPNLEGLAVSLRGLEISTSVPWNVSAGVLLFEDCRLEASSTMVVARGSDARVEFWGCGLFAAARAELLEVSGGASLLMADCEAQNSGGGLLQLSAAPSRAMLRRCQFGPARRGFSLNSGADLQASSCTWRQLDEQALTLSSLSQVLLRDCDFERSALLLEEAAAIIDRCRILGDGDFGVTLRARGASLEAEACELRGVGLSVLERAQAQLRGCRLSDSELAVSADLGALLELRDCVFECNQRSLLAQRKAELQVVACRFVGEGRAAVELSDGRSRFEACVWTDTETALRALARARVLVEGCSFENSDGVALELGSGAQLQLRHSRLGPRARSLCLDPKAKFKEEANRFEE
ncbi:MAG: hypothetical protein RBU37_00925 [Myxococcota bacterium]|jgi:uncharacterized protein YjbI with pentapeptide repeats|nr:hypothetical protein [Myxococcota bacterium]